MVSVYSYMYINIDIEITDNLREAVRKKTADFENMS